MRGALFGFQWDVGPNKLLIYWWCGEWQWIVAMTEPKIINRMQFSRAIFEHWLNDVIHHGPVPNGVTIDDLQTIRVGLSDCAYIPNTYRNLDPINHLIVTGETDHNLTDAKHAVTQTVDQATNDIILTIKQEEA